MPRRAAGRRRWLCRLPLVDADADADALTPMPVPLPGRRRRRAWSGRPRRCRCRCRWRSRAAPGAGSRAPFPARIAFGSGPITRRLAAYSAGQPPGVPRAAAMPDRVSPAATVYRAGAAGPGSARTVPGRMRPGSGPIGPPVGRVQRGPAAADAERGRDARQGVAGLHDVGARAGPRPCSAAGAAIVAAAVAVARPGGRSAGHAAGQGDLSGDGGVWWYCWCCWYCSRCGCSPGPGGGTRWVRPPSR